jgi:hypothetical protein
MIAEDVRRLHSVIDQRISLAQPSGLPLDVATGRVVELVPSLRTAMVSIGGASTPVAVTYPALPVAMEPGDRVVVLRRADGWLIVSHVLGRDPDTTVTQYVEATNERFGSDLQDAVDLADASGWGVWFPAGTHWSKPLTLPARMVLRGSPDATLKLVDGADASLITIPTASVRSVIEGFVLDGNRANNGGTAHVITTDAEVWLRDLIVTGGVIDGVEVTGHANGSRFETVLSHTNGRDGLGLYTSDLHLARCFAAGNGRAGIRALSELITIHGGAAWWNLIGVLIEGDPGNVPSARSTIVGMGIDRNLQAGLHIGDRVELWSFVSCSFNGNGMAAYVPDEIYGRAPSYTTPVAGKHPNVLIESTLAGLVFVGDQFGDSVGIESAFDTIELATSAAADDVGDTVTDHGFVGGDAIRFKVGTLVGGSGLSEHVTYFVTDNGSLAARTFQMSSTQALALAGTADVGWTTDITAGRMQVYIRPSYDIELAPGASVEVASNAHAGHWFAAMTNSPEDVRTTLGGGETYGDAAGDLHVAGAVTLGGSGATLHSGSGVPSAGLGANGDLYLRTDTPGTANQRIYVKASGAWSGVV